MSQMGMQMPGGHAVRRAQPDIYTALMLFAVVSLAAASVFVFMAGQRVGPDGDAFSLQQRGSVKLSGDSAR